QRYYQRRSALLSGLITPGKTGQVSHALAQVIEHREQTQARQTRALSAMLQEDLAREQVQTTRPPEQAALPGTQAAPSIPVPAPAVPPTPSPQEAKRSRWRALLAKLHPRRVPVLLQMSMVECGAACLAMILSYYGRRTSVSEVRERCQ